MAHIMSCTLREGQSIIRPPFFDGANYSYWKERMQIFIQSTNYQIWKIIVNWPEIPKKMVKGREVQKIEEEWNREDLKKIQLNAMVVNMMHCAISFNEYRKISRCKTAKEM